MAERRRILLIGIAMLAAIEVCGLCLVALDIWFSGASEASWWSGAAMLQVVATVGLLATVVVGLSLRTWVRALSSRRAVGVGIMLGLAILSVAVFGVARLATTDWPALPNGGFVSGRLATTQDVKAGNAAFANVRNGMPVGMPVSIQIPQYGLYDNRIDPENTRVIIIQAEEVDGIRTLGVRFTATGEAMPVPFTSVQLLGTARPAAKATLQRR